MNFLVMPEHQSWSVELIACLAISAVESTLENEDSTQLLRENCLDAEAISATTFFESAGRLEVLIRRFEPPMNPDEEHDLYECEAAKDAPKDAPKRLPKKAGQ
jgi:hypothetical protein